MAGFIPDISISPYKDTLQNFTLLKVAWSLFCTLTSMVEISGWGTGLSR